MEEIGLPTPDRKVSGSAQRNGKKDNLSTENKHPANENTRSLLRKRDLTRMARSTTIDPVKALKGRPRKILKQEEEAASDKNQGFLDPLNFNPIIDHDEVKMIEEDLKQEGNSEQALNTEGSKHFNSKADILAKGIPDDVMPIVGDNESEKNTMHMSMNNDLVKKPERHLSEAGSQH